MSGVHITVMPGDRAGLVGQNGAGKSTLLQCIAGYRSMDEGKCMVKAGVTMGEHWGQSGRDGGCMREGRQELSWGRKILRS